MIRCCFHERNMHHSRRKDAFSFKTMAAIHDNPLRRFLDNPLKTLQAAGLKPGDQVLEVGCGPGFFTISAAQLVGNEGCVHAIDINPLAVEMTGKKVKEAGLENVQLKIADASETGLPDESIDTVLLFSVLPHLPLDTALAEFARVLKHDGIIAVRGIGAMSVTKGGFFTFIGKKRGVYLFRKEQG